VRAFLAVALSDEARAAVGRTLETVRIAHPSARWVRPENLHLTVVFLGGIDEALVPELDARLAPLASATPPQVLRLEGVGAFPPSRERTLWLGVTRGAPWFVALATSVRHAIEPDLGLRLDDREPRAHVTLARLERPDRRVVDALKSAFEDHSVDSAADRLTLFSSVIRQGGPTYTPVREWMFGG
jgi:2'-5' RNA ligase